MQWYWLACALLLAGGSAVASDSINVVPGQHFNLQVQTLTTDLDSCYLINPAGEHIQLMPENQAEARFELQEPSLLFGCSVRVNEAVAEDTGLWEIHALTSAGNQLSDSINIYIRRENILDPEVSEANATWLPELEFIVRSGVEVNIALSKTDVVEECYVISPDGNTKTADDVAASTSVTMYGSTLFVSCRAVIGPIDGTLIGNWALCGKHTEDGKDVVRCQLAKIEWYNNNANYFWTPTFNSLANRVVNFGLTINPAVRSFAGTLHSCYVITPTGDNLQITLDSDYPGITRVPRTDTSLCTLAIGPVHAELLGNWTIYAKFTSVFGVREVHQPMNLFLYDEDNPYDQAYNVTTLDTVRRIVNLGVTVEHVVQSTGQRDNCYLENPSGQQYDIDSASGVQGIAFVTDNAATCRVNIGPITTDLLGQWMLTGKFSNNQVFTEIRQPLNIVQEDPENPAEDVDNREVQLMPAEFFDSHVGANHTLTISGADSFTTHETCHLITPQNWEYKLMEGFNLPGVEIIEDSSLSCGVTIHVLSGDLVGEWALISREQYHSRPYARRLPFTIYVEEHVPAIPAEVTIAEGNDFYIRLENPTDQYQTCVLLGPNGQEVPSYRLDPSYTESCGFIVDDIEQLDAGQYTIQYGSNIVYKAFSDVSVTERWVGGDNTVLEWAEQRSVDLFVGPEDAVYCRVEDPSGAAVFDRFGRCRIVIDRVTREHLGTWRIIVGTTGRVLTDEYLIRVVVSVAAKAVVTTHVEKIQPEVFLTCSIAVDEEINACKFRDPSGQILIASNGVAEDRFRFHGVGVSLSSDVTNRECGLRITNPIVADLGLWRCGIETANNTYYGFLSVICPWSMQDPEIAASVVTEPVLTAARTAVSAVEGEALTMSCNVQSSIRYCYFRNQRGTIYSVTPSTSTDAMSYVGAGFDAGECGIRLNTLTASLSGTWSCHVGFTDDQEPEQRAAIAVTIEEPMVVSQTVVGSSVLHIEALVHGSHQLDYCRFVRIDGVGFTTAHLPDGYSSQLSTSRCGLFVNDPNIIEHHPWTVVVKIAGSEEEISRTTAHTIPPGTGGSHGENENGNDNGNGDNDLETVVPPPEHTIIMQPFPYFTTIWLSVITVFLVLMLVVMALGPKKNREWTRCRLSRAGDSLRRSFRLSMHKPPLPADNNPYNTAVAA